MAETVHLFLKANGTDIKGDSTQHSLERKDSIEALFYEYNVKTAREAGSGMATGRRQYEPMLIRKRVDKATPLLFKALAENQKVEGVLKFYRPNPNGDGTTEQFFSISFKDGRVASHRIINPDSIVPATATQPTMEEITFVFHTISMVYTDGGIEHEDTWSTQK